MSSRSIVLVAGQLPPSAVSLLNRNPAELSPSLQRKRDQAVRFNKELILSQPLPTAHSWPEGTPSEARRKAVPTRQESRDTMRQSKARGNSHIIQQRGRC